MVTAKITFGMGKRDVESTIEAATDLLSCWYKNGQIVGDRIFVETKSGIDAYVTIPEANSLETAHNNTYVTQTLNDLCSNKLPLPKISILGKDPCLPLSCSCESKALVLFTSYISIVPPIRCLDCFLPVPLYRLPHIHAEEHLILLQWAEDYRACDTLQMHCTTGERFGEGQLAKHDSQLSNNGRDLCSRLEQATGKPVYYYLHKMRSRGIKQELARKCPSCGSDWYLDQSLHDIFDFRCDSCRLLANVSVDACFTR